MTNRLIARIVFLAAVGTMAPPAAAAQAIGGAERAKPVAGDPGMSSMVVIDDEHVRVLRNYAESGATRRMHAHKDATFHVLTLLTGQLRVTVEGKPPLEIKAGEVVSLEGGVSHSFLNTGSVTATMVEVFGKAPKSKP
jgi:quercetin dioxygenase-like cupin family protein